MFNRSLTLQPLEYTQHINRLYTAVEHLLGWLKRISLAKQDSPGQWIPDLFEDLDRLTKTMDSLYGAIQQPYIRLLIQDEHLKLKAGFALESRRQTADLAIVPPHNIVIGFYFPPEDYPMVDGEYPTITITLNDLTINTIQLDGTRRLYKPLGSNFWLHKNLLTLMQLRVYSYGKPYYTMQVFDSVNLQPSIDFIDDDGEVIKVNTCIEMYPLRNQQILHSAMSLGFRSNNLDRPLTMEYIRQSRNPNVLSYPYIRAANIIKRCWVKRKLQKKRHLVGAEIKILPDIGIDVLSMAERYQQHGITNHPDRQLVDPPRVRGNYDPNHNLEMRMAYTEETRKILSRLRYIEEASLEMKDCELSLKRLRQQQL